MTAPIITPDIRHRAAPATTTGPLPAVSVRPIPYPYQAMLAICSDLDETPDLHAYLETSRFLNTAKTTGMGPGVDLEVGNTVYFDMPAGHLSYWSTDDAGRASFRALIQSGHVDCLHSFGDLAATRAHAGRALEELARHDCRLEVWIDHAVAPTNFGADIMQGSGDLPGAPAYHADLTWGAGVRYVWRGRVTSVIGQDVPRRLGGLFTPGHPIASARTLAKEWAKGMLARRPASRYAMHRANRALTPTALRSGHAVYEFLRSNPHWGGVSSHDTADGLADVLTARFLDRLVAHGGMCVLYTHLGKTTDPRKPLSPHTRRALALLAGYVERRTILATTTRRLLGYCRALREASVHLRHDGGAPVVDIRLAGCEADADGLCVFLDDPAHARILLNGREASSVQRNPADETGRRSISLPRRRLEYPDV